MHQNVECSYRLRDRRTFQQRRFLGRLMFSRWSYVCHVSYILTRSRNIRSAQSHLEFTIRTMPQDPSRGAECHLVRESPLVPPVAFTTHASTLANTCSSPQIRNTFSPLPTTAPSAYGTSRRRAVSKRTSATKTQSTASPRASVSRAASGSCRGAKTARSICGTCKAERSCRYLMVIVASALSLPTAIVVC